MLLLELFEAFDLSVDSGFVIVVASFLNSELPIKIKRRNCIFIPSPKNMDRLLLRDRLSVRYLDKREPVSFFKLVLFVEFDYFSFGVDYCNFEFSVVQSSSL